MRLRRDSVLVASILYTIALLLLLPWLLRDAVTSVPAISTESDFWERTALQYIRYFGQTSLLIVIIGCAITWIGYFNRSRWTWLIQLVISVWVFWLASLVSANPILRGWMAFSVTEWLYIAIHQSGLARVYAECVLVFVLMVLSLLLTIKAVFWPEGPQSSKTHPRVKFAFAACAFVGISALFLWINFRSYSITPAELNSGRDLPPPPPPASAKE